MNRKWKGTVGRTASGSKSLMSNGNYFAGSNKGYEQIRKSFSNLIQSIREYQVSDPSSVAPQVFDGKSEQKLELVKSDSSSVAPQVFDEMPQKKRELEGQFEIHKLQMEKVNPFIADSHKLPCFINDLNSEPHSVVTSYTPNNLKPTPTFRSPITTSPSSMLHNHPCSYFSDKPIGDPKAQLSTIPVHVVNENSQFPVEFHNTSLEKKFISEFECEGADLCPRGAPCVMQLAFPDFVFAIRDGNMLIRVCKLALESSYIPGVIHRCKRGSEALCYQFGINVFDNQNAYYPIEKHLAEKEIEVPPQDHNFWTNLPKHSSSKNAVDILPIHCYILEDKNALKGEVIRLVELIGRGSEMDNDSKQKKKVKKGTYGFSIDYDGDTVARRTWCDESDYIIDETFLLWKFGRFGPIARVKMKSPGTEADELCRQGNCGIVAFLRRVDEDKHLALSLGNSGNFNLLMDGTAVASLGMSSTIAIGMFIDEYGSIRFYARVVGLYHHIDALDNGFQLQVTVVGREKLKSLLETVIKVIATFHMNRVRFVVVKESLVKKYPWMERLEVEGLAEFTSVMFSKAFLECVVSNVLWSEEIAAALGLLAIDKGETMQEVLSLLLDKLVNCCNHTGLSFVVKRGMVVAQLLSLEEAEKQKSYGMEVNLKGAQSNSSSKLSSRGNKTIVEFLQVKLWKCDSYSQDEMQSHNISSTILAIILPIPQPELEAFPMREQSDSVLLAFKRACTAVDNDGEKNQSVKGLGSSYAFYGSENIVVDLVKAQYIIDVTTYTSVSMQGDLLKNSVQSVLLQGTKDKLRDVAIPIVGHFQRRNKEANLLEVHMVMVLNVEAIDTPGKFQSVWQVQFTCFLHSWGQECSKGGSIVTYQKKQRD